MATKNDPIFVDILASAADYPPVIRKDVEQPRHGELLRVLQLLGAVQALLPVYSKRNADFARLQPDLRLFLDLAPWFLARLAPVLPLSHNQAAILVQRACINDSLLAVADPDIVGILAGDARAVLQLCEDVRANWFCREIPAAFAASPSMMQRASIFQVSTSRAAANALTNLQSCSSLFSNGYALKDPDSLAPPGAMDLADVEIMRAQLAEYLVKSVRQMTTARSLVRDVVHPESSVVGLEGVLKLDFLVVLDRSTAITDSSAASMQAARVLDSLKKFPPIKACIVGKLPNDASRTTLPAYTPLRLSEMALGTVDLVKGVFVIDTAWTTTSSRIVPVRLTLVSADALGAAMALRIMPAGMLRLLAPRLKRQRIVFTSAGLFRRSKGSDWVMLPSACLPDVEQALEVRLNAPDMHISPLPGRCHLTSRGSYVPLEAYAEPEGWVVGGRAPTFPPPPEFILVPPAWAAPPSAALPVQSSNTRTVAFTKAPSSLRPGQPYFFGLHNATTSSLVPGWSGRKSSASLPASPPASDHGSSCASPSDSPPQHLPSQRRPPRAPSPRSRVPARPALASPPSSPGSLKRRASPDMPPRRKTPPGLTSDAVYSTSTTSSGAGGDCLFLAFATNVLQGSPAQWVPDLRARVAAATLVYYEDVRHFVMAQPAHEPVNISPNAPPDNALLTAISPGPNEANPPAQPFADFAEYCKDIGTPGRWGDLRLGPVLALLSGRDLVFLDHSHPRLYLFRNMLDRLPEATASRLSQYLLDPGQQNQHPRPSGAFFNGRSHYEASPNAPGFSEASALLQQCPDLFNAEILETFANATKTDLREGLHLDPDTLDGIRAAAVVYRTTRARMTTAQSSTGPSVLPSATASAVPPLSEAPAAGGPVHAPTSAQGAPPYAPAPSQHNLRVPRPADTSAMDTSAVDPGGRAASEQHALDAQVEQDLAALDDEPMADDDDTGADNNTAAGEAACNPDPARGMGRPDLTDARSRSRSPLVPAHELLEGRVPVPDVSAIELPRPIDYGDFEQVVANMLKSGFTSNSHVGTYDLELAHEVRGDLRLRDVISAEDPARYDDERKPLCGKWWQKTDSSGYLTQDALLATIAALLKVLPKEVRADVWLDVEAQTRDIEIPEETKDYTDVKEYSGTLLGVGMDLKRLFSSRLLLFPCYRPLHWYAIVVYQPAGFLSRDKPAPLLFALDSAVRGTHATLIKAEKGITQVLLLLHALARNENLTASSYPDFVASAQIFNNPRVPLQDDAAYADCALFTANAFRAFVEHTADAVHLASITSTHPTALPALSNDQAQRFSDVWRPDLLPRLRHLVQQAFIPPCRYKLE